MRDTSRTRLITVFTLLAAVAVLTGSVLWAGYAVAALAFITIAALMLRPITRQVWVSDAVRKVQTLRSRWTSVGEADTQRAA